MISLASSGLAYMKSTAWRRPRSTARRKSPRVAAAFAVVTPTTLSSGGSVSLARTTRRYLSLCCDHSRSLDGAGIERDDALAEAAGLDQLGVRGLEAGGFQNQDRQRLAGRARVGVADLLALEVLGGLDRRVLRNRPHELGDGLHVVADDLEI